jgi:thiamine biosynthesis lipoprotein
MALIATTFSPPTEPARTGASGPLRQIRFPAMGTSCEIQYVCDDQARAAEFERTAVSWVESFEARYSRFRPSSLVSRINAAAGKEWIAIDSETEVLLQLCEMLHGTTHGILDPTILPLLRLWNYKAEHPAVPGEEQIRAALNLVGWKKVQRAPGRIFLPEPGMALDFGGFGKEYAVDVVAQIALGRGITNALIDFGHDIRALGAPPGRPAWHVGIENPRQPGTIALSVAAGGNRGIASSGDYIRQFTISGRRYGHIVDLRTGWPVAHGCLQSNVIAPTCLQAGILSTTAFVFGVPKAIEFIQSFPGAEGLLVTETARAQTRGFFNHVVTS